MFSRKKSLDKVPAQMVNRLSDQFDKFRFRKSSKDNISKESIEEENKGKLGQAGQTILFSSLGSVKDGDKANKDKAFEISAEKTSRAPRYGGPRGVTREYELDTESEDEQEAKLKLARWTAEQDAALSAAVKRHNGRNWKLIAEEVPGRSHIQCLQRWKKVLKPGLVKGHWTEQEDTILKQLMMRSENVGNWAYLAEQIPGRTAKQCRERWCLNLNPNINHGPWTPEEDSQLLELQKQLGNRWAEIANRMKGRTENAVKTRYKSLIRAVQKLWTAEEDATIIECKQMYNNRWVSIANFLKGRSRNSIKLRWKSLVELDPTLEESIPPPEGASGFTQVSPWALKRAHEVRALLQQETGRDATQNQAALRAAAQLNNSTQPPQYQTQPHTQQQQQPQDPGLMNAQLHHQTQQLHAQHQLHTQGQQMHVQQQAYVDSYEFESNAYEPAPFNNGNTAGNGGHQYQQNSRDGDYGNYQARQNNMDTGSLSRIPSQTHRLVHHSSSRSRSGLDRHDSQYSAMSLGDSGLWNNYSINGNMQSNQQPLRPHLSSKKMSSGSDYDSLLQSDSGQGFISALPSKASLKQEFGATPMSGHFTPGDNIGASNAVLQGARMDSFGRIQGTNSANYQHLQGQNGGYQRYEDISEADLDVV